MKKTLTAILSGLLFLPIYLKSDNDILYEKLLPDESPADIFSDIVKTKNVYRRDVVNIVSRFDEESRPEMEKYRSMGLIDGFVSALNDEIDEDRLFYAGKKYKENDLIIKNQMLSASWNILISKYRLFEEIDDTITMIKKKTTIESPRHFPYKIKINPELDMDNYIGIRMRVIPKNDSMLDDFYIRVNKEKVEIAKKFRDSRIGDNSTIDLELSNNYNEEFVFRAMLKVPFW